VSGRLHVFLYKGVREKLHEIANMFELPIEDDTLGHLLQRGGEYVHKLWEGKRLDEERLKELKAPREVITRLERKVSCFVSEGFIRRIYKMEREWEIDLFDTAHGHVMQTGLLWMCEALKTGAPKFLTGEDIEKLKQVYQPKVVYHR